MGRGRRRKGSVERSDRAGAVGIPALISSAGRSLLSRAGRLTESRWFLPAVLVLAASLRFGHVIAIHGVPWLEHLQLDHRIYDEWGQRIAAGDWIGSEAYFVDPLYAYFLAAIYSVFGHRVVLVLAIQAALGVATCFLTYLLGRNIFGRRLAGIACLGMAIYAPAIYYEALVEKTALSLFLFTLALVIYLRESVRAVSLAGLVLGLAALTRGNFLIFIPLGAIALLFRRSRTHPAQVDASSPPEGKSGPWLARMRLNGTPAARFFLIAFGVAGIAVLRNVLVAEVIATTTNVGQNLYIGNNAANSDGTYSPPSFVRSDPQFEETDFRTEAERRLDRQLKPQEISAYWRQQAINEMISNPGLSMERTFRKVRLFWHDYEIPDNADMYLAREDSPVLRMPLLSMGLVFPLALLGAVFAFRGDEKARLLTTIALVYFAGIVVFFVLARFRIQILPVLFVLAVYGAGRVVEEGIAKRWRRVAVSGCVLVCGFVFSTATPGWLEARKAPSLAIGYNNIGTLNRDADHQDAAIAAYEKAIHISPQSVVGAMRSVADMYLQRREFDKAESRMQLVLQYKPDSRAGREALVRLYETMARDPAYRDSRDVRQKLRLAYENVGRMEDARRVASDTIPGDATQSSSTAGTSGDGEAAIVRGLSAAGKHPVWFSTMSGDPGAEDLHLRLRNIFTRAGWVVRGEESVPFRVKPGIFLFAADERPPEYVAAIQSALRNGGIEAGFATGYRSYYESMKRTNPTWNGFSMARDQTFTLVIGPGPRR